MPAINSVHHRMHVLAFALERISDSATWKQYLILNPTARLGFRHLDDGRLYFCLINPISKGFDAVFTTWQEVMQFAQSELQSEAYRMEMLNTLGQIRVSLENIQ